MALVGLMASLLESSMTGVATDGTSPIYSDFQESWTTTKDSSRSPDRRWNVAYLGYGYAAVLGESFGNKYLEVSPSLNGLHASRIDSATSYIAVHGKLDARLDRQSQNNTQNWYSMWPMLAYHDETTHIYFILSTSGWEIGKKDNDLDPSLELQRFIKTGRSPAAQVGTWHTIEWWIDKDPDSENLRIRVDVDGEPVTQSAINGTIVNYVVDDEQWVRNGTTGYGTSSYFLYADKKMSLYQEGAQVSWDNVYFEELTAFPEW